MPEYKTPERIRKANAEWRKANRDKMNGYSVAWAQKNPASRLVISARARAKKRGMECLITAADIFVPDVCPILGIPLVCGTGLRGKPGGQHDSMSLDRIDQSKGYIPGNVQVISHLANSMKSSASPQQLLRFARWVLEVYGGE